MGRQRGHTEPQVAVRELRTLRGHADSLLEKRHLDKEAGLGVLPGSRGMRWDRLKEAGSRVVSNPQPWFPNPHPLREHEGILEQSPGPITLCQSKMASSPSHPVSPCEPRSNLFPTLPTVLLQALARGNGRSEGLRLSWCWGPPPCGPRAPCAASGRSPRRSCLCS